MTPTPPPWDKDGPTAMAQLCRLFPSLRKKTGADPWDAMKMLRFACDAHSHGELLAARFVLSVWNTTTNWEEVARQEKIFTDDEQRLPRFDLFEALGTWDENHKLAFLAWVRDPFWP